MSEGYQRSTCPPAGHSVIHKMRPFQTSLHPVVVAVTFIRKKIENSDEDTCVREAVLQFGSGVKVDNL